MENQNNSDSQPIARYLQENTECGKLGVWQRLEVKAKRKKGDTNTETEILVCISTTPFWLENVIQTESGETHLLVRYTAFGDEVKELEVPESCLADKRALAAIFYSNNFAGFGSSPAQLQNVVEYLRSSVLNFNKQRRPEAAYKHFGWTPDHEAFVIGNEIICEADTRTANVIGVPTEMREALREYGDSQTFTALSARLNKYKSHSAAFLIILGSVLLELLDIDGGGALSMVGPSGGGKSTTARFAFSAYAHHRGLSIAPQSTEKSFYEMMRLAFNLPIFCDEAHTIEPPILGRLIYAAGNGSSRATMRQDVTLREPGRFCTLLVLAGNGSVLGLDEKFINEAVRRRVLEISIDEPLDADLARELNEAAKADFGHVGRRIIEEAVGDTKEIRARLQRDVEWVFAQGVRREDRFSAWLIAAAKVAGEIARFSTRRYLEMDVEAACLHAISIVKANSKEIKTSDDLVHEAIAQFINEHQSSFSVFNAATRTNGQEWIQVDTGVRGEIVGRIKNEKGTYETAISRKTFSLWAHERGIDASHISRYLRAKNITEKPVKLVQHGRATRCLILPREETATQWPHLASVETPAQSASGAIN